MGSDGRQYGHGRSLRWTDDVDTPCISQLCFMIHALEAFYCLS